MPESNSLPLWLLFTLSTVSCWGLYGIFLHTGQLSMADPVHGRTKAFLIVGIAYFLTAVLMPIFLLWWGGAEWTFTSKGFWWSLAAGIVGAIGAMCVLLAFGAKGHPVTVMAIIFAGAPIVNAIVATLMHPPAGGWGDLRWQFVLGILLAAGGGTLVTLYKPPPGKAHKPAPPPVTETVETK